MTRVLVTGGAGFVGSHAAAAFLAPGGGVLVAADLPTGQRENVPAAASFEQIDIADAEALGAGFSFAPDVVCHLAAQASVTVSVADPQLDCRVNVLGTLNVCEAARE